MQNIAGKKRVRQEDVDSDYLFGDFLQRPALKRFRLRRLQAALNTHQKRNLKQGAGAIRRALKRGNSTKETRKSMLKRLKNLERLIGRSTKPAR
jgi:hypothetical protein